MQLIGITELGYEIRFINLIRVPRLNNIDGRFSKRTVWYNKSIIVVLYYTYHSDVQIDAIKIYNYIIRHLKQCDFNYLMTV
jgi:hypothetical protein